MIDLAFHGFSLVPGPFRQSESPLLSFALDEMEELPREEAAELLVSHPKITRQRWNGEWSDWRAVWSVSSGPVELDFTLMGENDELWGGSLLRGECELRELTSLLEFFRRTHPSIYLHDAECRMWSPEELKSHDAEPDGRH